VVAREYEENGVSPFLPGIRRTSIAALLIFAGATGAQAEVGIPSVQGGADPYRHVQALQDIATANGGNRAAGAPGYDRSAEYVADHLRNAGYRVRFEEFTFPYSEERSPPALVLGPAGPDPFATPQEALRSLRNSGSGDVTAPLRSVDLGLSEGLQPGSTSGCEREDFAGFVPGQIALVRRGTCPFQAKVEHAQAAGAAGVIIMNQGTEGQTDAFTGRLSTPAPIPVLSVTTETGRRLAAAAQDPAPATVRVKVDVETGTRSTRNVIADRGEISGAYVVVGGHLDSVPEGPGMNDNASGSSAVLEAALRLAREPPTGMPIRFAFWGAEERGLVGSRHHVSALPEDERRRIGLYINLDMVGSPNFGRFIHVIEENKTDLATGAVQALKNYFGERGLATEERTGYRRGFGSDDASFAAAGIPTIGLFTGANGAKNAAHAERFGGIVEQPFDPCYHQACDTTSNVNPHVLAQITDALTQALRQITPRSPPSDK
jgi:Zn-dependent M28 family amino/carboxypeptidase